MFYLTYSSTRPASHDPEGGCRFNPDGAGRDFFRMESLEP
jgi:hypothetical protein